MRNPRGQAFSETWWGSRWIQSLRRFGGGWSRGLANARGATDGIRDLKITPGCVEAAVPGADGATHQLRVRLHTLPDATWRRVLRRLAGKALYAARLLSGEMPRDIERVFSQSRASLFPRRGREIEFTCSCDQDEVPCAHVAAVQFVLAEAFDRDPFLLFELRGRSRKQVLAELRDIRGAGAGSDRGGADLLNDEDAWTQPNPEDYTVAGEDLATLGFHIAAAEVPVGAIRALGPPRSWAQPLAVLKAFVPLYRAASAAALEIAWLGEEAVPTSAQLPEPETETALVAMAESMAKPTLSSDDLKPPSRRRGGRRRGRRGQGHSGQPKQGRRRKKKKKKKAQQGSSSGAADQNQAAAGSTGKKKRRRRGRGRGGSGAPGAGNASGGGASGSASGSTSGGGSGSTSGGGSGSSGNPSTNQPGKRRRRRRRRGGGGSSGGGGSTE